MHSGSQIPFGLADTRENLAYVVGEQGLINCLDIDSGKVLARTEFPGEPLAIEGGKLVGWGPVPDRPDTIQVFAAVRRGNVLSPIWEYMLDLPSWVDVRSTEPNRFTLEAEIERTELVITWEAHSRYEGGAPPPPEVEKAHTRDERRIIRLGLESGESTSEKEVELDPSLPQAIAELPLNKRIVPYRLGATWVTHPWRQGSSEALLVSGEDAPGIVLVRHNQEGTASPFEVRLTDHAEAEAAVTPDGNFVLIREASEGVSAWRVFSTVTGEQIASLPFELGTEGVAIVKDKVLYTIIEDDGRTIRRSLRCRTLDDAEVKWSLLLSEEARKAPRPPAP